MGGDRKAKKAAQEALFKAHSEAVATAAKGTDVPDFTTPYSSTGPGKTIWDDRLEAYKKALLQNAYSYYNVQVVARKEGRFKPLGRRKKRKPVKIISAAKFPLWCTVTYTYPPLYAFKTLMEARKIKHIVLHSMGHSWHAGRKKNKKGNVSGWMNSKKSSKGVMQLPATHPLRMLTGHPFVYIPKGTTNPITMEHYRRFKNGMQYLLRPHAGATAHFMIDRAGNIVINGSVNDMMFTSDDLNFTSVGIELEEAFYTVDNPKDKKPPATWLPGRKNASSPQATAGTIEYWPYSEKQLDTLAVLCCKLELAYPDIADRYLEFKEEHRSMSSPPGYSMHAWVGGSMHPDTSPHFQTQEEWDVLFEKIDKLKEDIKREDCFRSAIWDVTVEGKAFVRAEYVEAPFTIDSTFRQASQQDTATALARAKAQADKNRKVTGKETGAAAVKKSGQLSKEQAATTKTQKGTLKDPPKPDKGTGEKAAHGSFY